MSRTSAKADRKRPPRSLMAGSPPVAPMENALSDPSSGSKSKGKTMAPGADPYFVYLLLCADGSYYVGSTSDVVRREQAHNDGRGAKYTAGRRPVRVVYSEAHESRSAAQAREAQIKRWSHAKKEALVGERLDRLHRLARRRHD